MIVERLRAFNLVLEEAHRECEASVVTISVPRTILHGHDTIEDLRRLRAQAETVVQTMEALQATHAQLMQAVDSYRSLSVANTHPVSEHSLTVHDGRFFAEASRVGLPRTPDEVIHQHKALQKTQREAPVQKETPALAAPLFVQKGDVAAVPKKRKSSVVKKIRTVTCGSLFGLQVREQTPRVENTETYLGEQHFSCPLSPALSRQHAKTLRQTSSPLL